MGSSKPRKGEPSSVRSVMFIAMPTTRTVKLRRSGMDLSRAGLAYHRLSRKWAVPLLRSLAELWDWRDYIHGAPNGAWLRSKSSVLAAVWLAAAFTAPAATITECFTTNPLTRGWRVFGSTNLFAWDATNQNLKVTWDSSQTNSYFYVPLGTILDRYDDFSLSLDLKLFDVAAGVATNKPSTFQLALGFLNLVDRTKTNVFRRNGHASPNLAEFDFFPQAGIIAPT